MTGRATVASPCHVKITSLRINDPIKLTIAEGKVSPLFIRPSFISHLHLFNRRYAVITTSHNLQPCYNSPSCMWMQ